MPGRLDADKRRRERRRKDPAPHAELWWEGCEERKLILPGVDAARLKAPGLVSTGAESKRRERNRAFGDPSVRESTDRYFPDRIPVAVVQAFVCKLSFVPAAGRRNAKLDTVTSVMKRVEHER